MAFTVQDETGSVVGANAYVTVAEFKSYHTDRNQSNVLNSDFGDGDIQAAIIRGTDYLDSRYRFIGTKKQETQTTQWPRHEVENRDGFLISDVPTVVKEACMELAVRAMSVTSGVVSVSDLNPDPERDVTGRKVIGKRQKLDVLEEETRYSAGAAFIQPDYPLIDNMLKNAGLIIASQTVSRG